MAEPKKKRKVVILEGTTLLSNKDLVVFFQRLCENSLEDAQQIFGDGFTLTQKPRVQEVKAGKPKRAVKKAGVVNLDV